MITFDKNTGDGQGLYTFVYDYRTRRIETTKDADPVTTFVFSGGTSVQELEGGVLAAEFVRGSDIGGGVGGMLYSLRSGTPSYTHYNARGDVVAKTDGAGVLTYQAAYEAWGEIKAESGSTPDRQKSNSKDRDVPGYANEGFRYRDLETGAFLSKDPAGFVDGPNVYAYVRQNPWTGFDPEGLETRAELEDARNRLEAGYNLQRKEIQNMDGITSEERETGLKTLDERYKKSRAGIDERIGKIERTAKDMAQIYGGDAGAYYQQLDDAKLNVQELIGLLEHADSQGVRAGIVDTIAGDFSSGGVTLAKGFIIDRLLRRIPGVGGWLKRHGSDLQASAGGKRRKPGSFGKFKGTDALRRENETARAAANAAGLNQDQARRLHDEISGKGYGYREILEAAKRLKGGGE